MNVKSVAFSEKRTVNKMFYYKNSTL